MIIPTLPLDRLLQNINSLSCLGNMLSQVQPQQLALLKSRMLGSQKIKQSVYRLNQVSLLGRSIWRLLLT
ncbi:hypothetical protein CHR29_18260 [Pseudomonas monteilii]|nr:hypothetical protein CHR29_18260 [Pseudomonas monteilii]AYN99395.1 hypothetical protein D8767_10600 [Pseudomonas sp. LTGT-11-2Z]